MTSEFTERWRVVEFLFQQKILWDYEWEISEVKDSIFDDGDGIDISTPTVTKGKQLYEKYFKKIQRVFAFVYNIECSFGEAWNYFSKEIDESKSVAFGIVTVGYNSAMDFLSMKDGIPIGEGADERLADYSHPWIRLV